MEGRQTNYQPGSLLSTKKRPEISWDQYPDHLGSWVWVVVPRVAHPTSIASIIIESEL